MTSHEISSSGDAPVLSDVHVVAFYDSKTGHIRHTHTVTVYKGGRAVSEKEAIEAAHAHAKKAGHDTAKLKMQISKDLAHGTRPHRIDVKTKKFVPFETRQA